MMLNPGRAAAILSELGDIHVTIAIDDFGTGYSSLAYLDRLPAACIKVDQSFVQRVETESGAREIVRAAVAMAHAMGMEVVAEGVENARAIDLVTELGCDLAQGYYLCRPLPAPECRAWMERPGGLPEAAPQPA
ncbi:MAG: EAL domain-containing protein, partial [Gammaproteobacteria bacterium]|nr:EAL domain-containing protein [Gammaproteobacteria bacterium]